MNPRILTDLIIAEFVKAPRYFNIKIFPKGLLIFFKITSNCSLSDSDVLSTVSGQQKIPSLFRFSKHGQQQILKLFRLS